MRVLTGILFLAGIFWASMAWIFVLSPIGIFQPEYQYKTRDTIQSIAASVTSLVGYFVWLSWGWFALKGRYPWGRRRLFWLISLAQHVAWLPFFAYMREEAVFETLGDQKMTMFTGWIVMNIVIATFCLILPLKNKELIQSPQPTPGLAPRHG